MDWHHGPTTESVNARRLVYIDGELADGPASYARHVAVWTTQGRLATQ